MCSYIQTLFAGTQSTDIFTRALTHQLPGDYLLFSPGSPGNKGEVVSAAQMAPISIGLQEVFRGDRKVLKLD